MAAILADLQPGEEVIMPSYTFVSTDSAFVLRGAVPVFVDIRPDTLNLDERLRSLAGVLIAPLLGPWAGWIASIHAGAWWTHLASLLFFLAYLPVSKHFHVVTALPSVLFRRLDRGALPAIDLENSERFGVTGFLDLGWKDLLDVYSCTECGRCQDACSALATGKPLNPKKINEEMRDVLPRAARSPRAR